MMTDFANSPESLVFPVETVRDIDRAAIEGGIDGFELMTRAAQFALDTALAAYPSARRWQLLCGSGNNAGDAWLLASLAAAEGIEVSLRWLVHPDKLDGDARRAYEAAEGTGLDIAAFDGELDVDAELLVDGMLGSGLARDVGGEFAAAVDAINRHPAAVLALDVPTGLHADTGRIMGTAVRANLTTTFVAHKPGLFLHDGPDCCGQLRFASLGVGDAQYRDRQPAFRLVPAGLARRALPRRPRQSHKGHYGHVLVVGGGPGMPGAVRLAAEAALRAGAGRVSVATHPAHAATLPAACPELMCHAITDGGALLRWLEDATVVAFGPGLGSSDWARSVFEAIATESLPTVMDADALNWLAHAPTLKANRILTPHPGEAGRLLGCSAGDVQADRPAALKKLREHYGGTIVLKGCGTLISSEASPWLCPAGNPGMAAPGMGDLLTGIIAGLLAQGLDAETAAVAGVDLHARAGDAAARHGERGMLASDLLGEIRRWLNP